MKGFLLALGFALTNCESRPPVERAPAPPVRPPAAGAVPPRSPAAPAPGYPPAAHDTLAQLRHALGHRLPGFVVERFAVGNLDPDNRPDFLVVCRSRQPVSRGRPDRVYAGRLAVLLNRGWPQLRLAAVSDRDIDCLGNGCRFNGVAIERRSFSVASLEGDCEKTYTVRTYRYAPPQGNWQLYKVGERIYSMCSYNAGENDYREATRRDFGRVVFGE